MHGLTTAVVVREARHWMPEAVIINFVHEYTINQLVGPAFGAAGQHCMALTTAVVVGEVRHWMPEVAIILILFRSTRLTSWLVLAFGAAGQRCMALTTAVVVGEARH